MRTSVTIPEKLYEKIKQHVEDEGFMSINDFLLSLVREKVKPLPFDDKPKPTPISTATMVFDVPKFTPNNEEIQKGSFPIWEIPDTVDMRNDVSPLPESQPQIQPVLTLPSQQQDNYLLYGGKCQYKAVSPDGIICIANATKKMHVAQNLTGDIPLDEEFKDVYLCLDHVAEVSHRSGFFVK